MAGPPATIPLGAQLHRLSQPWQLGTRMILRLQLLCVHLRSPTEGVSRIRAFPIEAAGAQLQVAGPRMARKAIQSWPCQGHPHLSHPPGHADMEAGSRQSCCSSFGTISTAAASTQLDGWMLMAVPCHQGEDPDGAEASRVQIGPSSELGQRF